MHDVAKTVTTNAPNAFEANLRRVVMTLPQLSLLGSDGQGISPSLDRNFRFEVRMRALYASSALPCNDFVAIAGLRKIAGSGAPTPEKRVTRTSARGPRKIVLDDQGESCEERESRREENNRWKSLSLLEVPTQMQ